MDFLWLASQCFPLIRRTWFNIPCTSPSGFSTEFHRGFLATTYLVGGYFFERDLKLLEVNWQEVTQLFNRGGGQWLYMGIFILTIFIAALLGGIVFFASKFWIALVVNVIATGLLVLIALIIYLFVDRRRWKRIRTMFLPRSNCLKSLSD